MFGDMITDLANSGCFQATKIYRNKNGSVLLGQGEKFYYVAVVKQTAPAQQLVRERGRLDYISAIEFFNTAVRYVNGEIEWVEPNRKFSCKYNPNKSRGCTDKNCPRTLGGADYREIFGASCPFRKLPRTR